MTANSHSTLIEIRKGRKVHLIYINNDSQNTLFFLHGAGGRVDQWREQIGFFKDKYNIVALDYLGHGESEKPKTANLYRFEELFQDIQMIFTRYKTEKNFVLAHSYGGAFAMHLALIYPKKIEKLVLISPTNLKPRPIIAKAFFLPISLLELIRPHLENSFVKVAFHPDTNPSLIKREMNLGRKNPMSVLKPLILAMRHIPPADIRQIQQETLIIMGERDFLIPEQEIKGFYYQLPHVRFVTIKNAAHLSLLEQPKQVNQLIQDFLFHS